MKTTSKWILLFGVLALGPSSGRVVADEFTVEDVFAQPIPWSSAGGQPQPENSSVQLVLDPSGRPHLVINVPGGAIYYAVREAAGWQIERVDSADYKSYGLHCSIALGPDGAPNVVYFDDKITLSGQRLLYKRRGPLDGNGNWPPKEEIYPGQIHLTGRTSIAVDDSGRVHLAYPTRDRFWYTERVGGVWSLPIRPLPLEIGSPEPSLALSPLGEPLIAYNHSTRVFLASRTGGVWSNDPVVDPPANSAETNPSLAMTPGGEPGVAFTLESNGLGHIARAGGAWLPFESEPIGGNWPCIAYGPLVVPTILHRTGAGGLTLTKAYGDAWPSQEVTSEVVRPDNYWLGVDHEGRSHVVYQIEHPTHLILRYAVQNGVSGVGRPSVAPRPALSIRPNPARVGAELALTLAPTGASRARVEVLDVQGRRVLEREIGLESSSETVVPLTVPGVPAGVYAVRVSTPRGTTFRKVVLLP